MAKVTTLQDKAREIMRRYKKINAHRFVYNKPSELKSNYTHIKCWFLIHDSEKGYSVFPFTFKRKALFSVPQWTTLFKKAVGEYQPLFNIFTQAVLPAINNKGGNNWRFKALLCWTGIAKAEDAISKTKNSAKRRRRDTATNKRNANARKRHRSR